MKGLLNWVERTQPASFRLLREFWSGLVQKGARFFCVALAANFTGLGLGYYLFKRLSPFLSILVISTVNGVLHVLITYSSHYYFTFKNPGNYLKGLWKVYVTAWLGMLISSLLNQVLIGSLHFPYFLAQALIFCFGAAYSLVVNFLFVFRRQSS